MRFRRRRAPAAVPPQFVVGAALPAVLTQVASAEPTTIFDTVSPPADAVADLFYLVLGITGIIGLLVGGMLIYCILRFRRRRDDASEPPQIYGSQPIEVAWTVGPLLTVFVLFLVVIRSIAETKPPTDLSNALEVRVIGHQWWWEFRYPELGITTANELHVPARTAVKRRPIVLKLESADVVHSFWVPRLSGKTDLIPGRVNEMWFETSQIGVYRGQCAEYCGTQHANMLIHVVVQSEDDFQAWVADQRKPAGTPAVVPDAVAAGREVFLTRTCVNCHTVRDISTGDVGPDLTHLASRETLAAGVIRNTRENLAAWIRDPQSIKPGCEMPTLRLTETELDHLVAFLESLK